MRTTRYRAGIVLIVAIAGLAGCAKKGPLEKAGEEVDEAVHTVKNGGKETTADKIDDAADKVRDKVEKTVK